VVHRAASPVRDVLAPAARRNAVSDRNPTASHAKGQAAICGIAAHSFAQAGGSSALAWQARIVKHLTHEVALDDDGG
jgi:hypothetical protein